MLGSLEWARWAVGRWANFPVDQIPRPLVLVGPRAIVEQGFKTGEAKLAFVEGAIESSVAMPDAVLRELARQGRSRRSRAVHPLLITEAEVAEAEFLTDRGSRRLTAWRLTVEDALGPIWVLDPDIPDWSPGAADGGAPPRLPAPTQGPGARVDVGPDDCALTLHWLAAPPVYEQYPTAEILESPDAVTLVPVGFDIGPEGPRQAIGHIHRVTASLQRPLGSRVFVDLNGNAGQAIRTADGSRVHPGS